MFNKFSEHVALKLAQQGHRVILDKNKEFLISEIKDKEGLLLSKAKNILGDNNCLISWASSSGTPRRENSKVGIIFFCIKRKDQGDNYN